MATTNEVWAQLVSSMDFDSPPVLITNEEFTIGRAKACDLIINDNKMVSGRHCKLFRDPLSKEVWLQDSSTNGTLVNLTTKVSKGQKVEIHHGDEIHIVFRKDEEESNVAFLFQDMATLESEMSEETIEYSHDDKSGDETQEYEALKPVEEMSVLKRSHADLEDGDTEEPAAKKSKMATKEQHQQELLKGEDFPQKAAEITEVIKPAEITETTVKTKTTEMEKAMTESEGKKDEGKEEIDSSTCMKEKGKKTTSSEETTSKEAEAKQSKMMKSGVMKETKTEMIKQLIESSKDVVKDEMEEALLCGICQDILHDCISLQPCMHSFCASCYSPWMERSNECPSCRNQVQRISRNHIVNNLIEAYLKEHPEKRRSDEEIKELNSKNKITDDMLQPKVGRRNSDDYDSDDDEEDEDIDDDDDGDDDGDNQHNVPLFGFGARVINAVGGLLGLGVSRPPPTICRQCPGNASKISTTSTPTLTTASTATMVTTTTVQPESKSSGSDEEPKRTEIEPSPSDGKSKDAENQPSTSRGTTGDETKTSGAKMSRTTPDGIEVTMPEPPNYVCNDGQVHLMCLCCKQAMPDRRTEATVDPTIPAQQCDICHRGYCHMYWGCQRVDCYGCLNHFRDMNFGRKCLTSLVNDNYYESEIFRNYMEDKTLAVKDVLTECLARLDRGEYISTDAHNFRGRKGSDVRICYPCGLRNFKELAYQFRRDIPRAEFPASVTSRPDCYWGKNCRTQRNRPHHAARFSHICDQIRT